MVKQQFTKEILDQFVEDFYDLFMEGILEFTNKKAARVIKKTLSSAIANATNNFKMDEDKLVVSTIMVNQGPVLKRVMPRAMGRADIIRKPTAHITVAVSDEQ